MNSKELTHVLERAAALCHERGVRLTEQRRAVLRLLCVADKPLSAYELLERIRGVVKNPAPPTIYRALEFLLEQGLVHKLESLHAYVGCTHPDHPHASQFLICDDCGEVAESVARESQGGRSSRCWGPAHSAPRSEMNKPKPHHMMSFQLTWRYRQCA